MLKNKITSAASLHNRRAHVDAGISCRLLLRSLIHTIVAWSIKWLASDPSPERSARLCPVGAGSRHTELCRTVLRLCILQTIRFRNEAHGSVFFQWMRGKIISDRTFTFARTLALSMTTEANRLGSADLHSTTSSLCACIAHDPLQGRVARTSVAPGRIRRSDKSSVNFHDASRDRSQCILIIVQLLFHEAQSNSGFDVEKPLCYLLRIATMMPMGPQALTCTDRASSRTIASGAWAKSEPCAIIHLQAAVTLRVSC